MTSSPASSPQRRSKRRNGRSKRPRDKPPRLLHTSAMEVDMRGIRIAIALGAALIGGCRKAEPPRQFWQAPLNAALADPARKDHGNADARRPSARPTTPAAAQPAHNVPDPIRVRET